MERGKEVEEVEGNQILHDDLVFKKKKKRNRWKCVCVWRGWAIFEKKKWE